MYEKIHAELSIAKPTPSITVEWLDKVLPPKEKIPNIDKNIQRMGYEEVAEILHQRSKIMGYNQALSDCREALLKNPDEK